MNETILNHLARTQAILETLIETHAAIIASKLNITEESAIKNVYQTITARTVIIAESLRENLQNR